MINLSEIHHIELAPEYQHMVDHAPLNDFAIRKISSKIVNDQPLIQTHLVIAGTKTRTEFPRADLYPVHFVKTYYPTSFHADPKIEFDNATLASTLFDSPAPIGYNRNSVRTCFLPGTPFDRLSPLGIEPLDRNIQVAREMPLAQVFGLWKLMEEVFASLTLMHSKGFYHCDMELHNVIVSHSPVRAFLIDFETAQKVGEDLDADAREKLRFADLLELSRQAVYLQCAVGIQDGDLAHYTVEHLEALFPNVRPFESSLADKGVYSP